MPGGRKRQRGLEVMNVSLGVFGLARSKPFNLTVDGWSPDRLPSKGRLTPIEALMAVVKGLQYKTLKRG